MVQRGRQWWISKEWTPGWFLINYEALRPDILDQPWDGIIIDESTRIRNPKANITKLLLNHTDHVKHKAMLTGLPNPEASWDYFCQFQFLHGHFMGMDNYWAWRHRYFHQGVPSWNWQPNRGTREAIREYVHENAFVLQRKTAGVGSEKRRHTIVVPMNKAQKIAMRTIRREMAIAGVETKWATVAHLWMQRLAGGWHPTLDNPPYLLSERKMKALRKLLKKVKVAVVWFRFNHEIESTYRYLRKSMPHLRLRYVHGAMAKSKELRVKYQEQFQAGKLDVLLLQVKLGRFGWNLSRSDVAIYYSNSYEYEDRSQSEDRLIHLTKTRDCHYYDLVTEHSTDEDLVESLRSKKITARLFGRRIKESLKRLIGRAA
jgi:hypothetical protein